MFGDRNQPDQAPLHLTEPDGGGAPPPPAAPLHPAVPEEPASGGTAIERANADLAEYDRRARALKRRSNKLENVGIGLAATTFVTGGVTAYLDEGTLGIATTVLGALTLGLDRVRSNKQYSGSIAAYQIGWTELESAIATYEHRAEFTAADDSEARQALGDELLESLRRVNLAITKALPS